MEIYQTNNDDHIVKSFRNILITHEASHECIWLRSMFQHIRESYKLSFVKGNLTILYEDNVACIA